MRIEQITFTRFIAAISIVVFHFGTDIFPFNNNLLSYLFLQANIGVSYFFILSGFIMMVAYSNKSEIDSFEYYRNRFARIYPVYFFAIILLVVYIVITKGHLDYLGFVLNLFLIQSWVPGEALSFNSPGWSLSVELLFYAIFPILFNSIYKIKNAKIYAVPIFLFFIISQFIFHWFVSSEYYHGFSSKSHDLIYYFPLMHLNTFLIGNMAGLFFINRVKKGYKNYDWHILIISVAIIIALKYPFGLDFHNGLFSLLFVPFILLMSLNNGKIAAISKSKLFVFLGEISFGIYILQYPIFKFAYFLSAYLGIINKHIIFYFTTIILVVISGISYVYLETPLRDKLKNINLNRF